MDKKVDAGEKKRNVSKSTSQKQASQGSAKGGNDDKGIVSKSASRAAAGVSRGASRAAAGVSRGASRAAAGASRGASRAAAGASKSLSGGMSALRDVRRAAKQRADAQADVRDIKRGLEEDRELLTHRTEIENNYESIVAEQTAEIAQAEEEISKAEADIAKLEGESKRLTEELRTMRERHEQKLRPYRNLMESSRGRSDDAAKVLADSRRAVRNAESALNNATKRRQQRIDAANRAVDNAKERLSAVEDELRMLSTDETASPEAVAKVQAEIESEQRHLSAALDEVGLATQDAQDAVDQAQQKLWALQRELSDNENTAAAAKHDATVHKDEYDSLYKDAQAKEKAMEDDIKLRENRVRDLTKKREAAQDRKDDAQYLLDEANEIHAHPETTHGLRERIADEEADLADAQDELDELAARERELRRVTRKTRYAVIAVAVFVLALVIFLVWFFVFRQQ